ncbi:MAG: RCC1 domain-containing protein [Acidimicrobiales bacterium]
MRFKALAAVVAALALMGAAVGVASATNRSDRSKTVPTSTAIETTVPKLEPAAGLVGDDQGTCALLRSGRVECWGANTYGALGNGTVASVWYSDVALAAKGLSGVARLVSDGDGYCAVLKSELVKCWGYNHGGFPGAPGEAAGLLGDASGEEFSDVPVTVKGLTGVKSLVSDRNGYGSAFGFCAVWGRGGVKCWGSNDAVISGGVTGTGLLGNGSNETSSDVPVTVKGLTDVKSLASDQAGYCALLRSGRAECWGDNDYNELGDGQLGDLAGSGSSTQVSSNVPVVVKGLTSASSLASDGIGYCALLRSGGVQCWGNNSFGELGDGSKPSPKTNYGSDVPVRVKGLADAVSLSGTDYGYCAQLRNGGAKCWGSNSFDELGDGRPSTAQAYSAVAVTVKGLAGAATLVGGDDNGSTGSGYTYCAVLKTSTAVCWGQNGYGELGDDGSESASDVPVAVKGLAGVASLEVGTGSACGVMKNGGAECWGYVAGTVPADLAGIGP